MTLLIFFSPTVSVKLSNARLHDYIEKQMLLSRSHLVKMCKRNTETPVSPVCSILVIQYVNFLQGKLSIF